MRNHPVHSFSFLSPQFTIELLPIPCHAHLCNLCNCTTTTLFPLFIHLVTHFLQHLSSRAPHVHQHVRHAREINLSAMSCWPWGLAGKRATPLTPLNLFAACCLQIGNTSLNQYFPRGYFKQLYAYICIVVTYVVTPSPLLFTSSPSIWMPKPTVYFGYITAYPRCLTWRTELYAHYQCGK